MCISPEKVNLHLILVVPKCIQLYFTFMRILILCNIGSLCNIEVQFFAQRRQARIEC